ncbi:protein fem-1 homolog A-A-like [Uloborus diversus]|uniref:protein fem-1 homolog A-A-like n=1 Tax=Uloborus diversus TaxID=327109 RepID=UPI002409F6AE|nr:protein fem-1 homolog A-A-like [Uloborus diversus]
MPLKRQRRAVSLDDISDLKSQKELIFNELLTECEISDTLSFIIRVKLQRFPLEVRREIVSRRDCAPLFAACGHGHLETVKYLIKQCDADIEKRENGADPVLKNKHADDALQTACFCNNKGAFEYLIEKYTYSKERIAEAYELMGSTVLEESGNIREALSHWRTALSLRNEDPNNYLVKKAIPQKASNPKVTEFTSEKELDIFALDMDAMKMQSLLVRERILGPFHKNTISSLRNLWESSALRDHYAQ